MIINDFKICIDEYIKDFLSLNPESEEPAAKDSYYTSDIFNIYIASRILKANNISPAGIGEAEKLLKEYAAESERSELLNNIADGMQYIKHFLERSTI